MAIINKGIFSLTILLITMAISSKFLKGAFNIRTLGLEYSNFKRPFKKYGDAKFVSITYPFK